MLKAIVADDSVVMRDRMRGALASFRMPIEVHCCANGQLALEAARTGRYDIAILDVIMSPMTGLEAAQLMLEEQLCKVVMVTSMGQRAAAFSLAVPVLIKPFADSMAHAAVERALCLA